MTDRSRADQTQPSLKPRPSRIVAEPATVERCAEDYAAGAPVRTTGEHQWRRDARRR